MTGSSVSAASAKFIEGLLTALTPFVVALAALKSGETPPLWRIAGVAVTAVIGLAASRLLFKRSRLAKWLFLLYGIGVGGAVWPTMSVDPAAALFFGVLAVAGFFWLIDYDGVVGRDTFASPAEAELRRVRGAATAVLVLVLLSLLSEYRACVFDHAAFFLSGMVAIYFFCRWLAARCESVATRHLSWLVGAAGVVLLAGAAFLAVMRLALLIESVALLFIPGYVSSQHHAGEHWWDVFINHPARSLISTFLLLSVVGTLLLRVPAASVAGVSAIDAVFTAVSAVCVTGLSVVNAGSDLTPVGQCFLLLLIQLGGIGIMTIATVALHALGRLSLNQESTMNQLTDTTAGRGLFESLLLMLRFTFAVEFIGALLLSFGFFMHSEEAGSIWRGIFTAVSAFCNAGFSLDPDSLESYQNNPIVLYTVSGLIIAGGLAPAACLSIPRWMSGRSVPEAIRIALVMSAALLAGGSVLILIFEWNHSLAGLDLGDKINNAFFQSVTLRTAGFNSVNIAHSAGPTLLFMMIFMFIGGSPGGTAGGIKTTTLAVLLLTFWANVTGRGEIVVSNRRIRHTTVYRAVTITVAFSAILLSSVTMLSVTQSEPLIDLAFEAVSALGTVGLSLGVTPRLDAVGKLIVVITMFVGRVGPLTIFMLLYDGKGDTTRSRCPDARITLT